MVKADYKLNNYCQDGIFLYYSVDFTCFYCIITKNTAQTVKIDIMKQIGALIRCHRDKSNLTQKQLADLAGVGKTAVFDIEHGKETVQFDTLHKVCSVLNITIRLESPIMEQCEEEAGRAEG